MKALLLVAVILACLAAYSSVEATNVLSRRRSAKAVAMVKPGTRKKVLRDVQRFQQPSAHECYTGAVSSIVDYYASTPHLIRGDGKKCRCAPLVGDTLASPKYADRKAAFEAKVSRNRKQEADTPTAERDSDPAAKAPSADAEVEPDEVEDGPEEGKCPVKCAVDPILVGVATDSAVAGHAEGHGAPVEVVLREFGLLKDKVDVKDSTDLHQLFKDIRDQIKARKPVVIAVMSGSTGHATVCAGFSYDIDDKGKIVKGTKQLYIIDPWYSEKDPYWVKFPDEFDSKKRAIFPVQQCKWKLNKICYTKSPLPERK